MGSSVSENAWRCCKDGTQEEIRTEEHGETFRVVDVVTVLLLGGLPS
jgi:hypothetical protein